MGTAINKYGEQKMNARRSLPLFFLAAVILACVLPSIPATGIEEGHFTSLTAIDRAALGLSADPTFVNHLFGSGLANLGDLDGDGFEDVAVSTYVTGANTRLYVLLLNQDKTLKSKVVNDFTVSVGCEFGATLASLGDVDGDGVADLVSTGAACVTVVLLNADGSIKSVGSSLSLFSDLGDFHPNVLLGLPLAVIQDLNGDGIPEFVVGNPDISQNVAGSYIQVLSTTSTGVISTYGSPVTAPPYAIGVGMASIGDIDGDGHRDLLVFGDDGTQFTTLTIYYIDDSQATKFKPAPASITMNSFGGYGTTGLTGLSNIVLQDGTTTPTIQLLAGSPVSSDAGVIEGGVYFVYIDKATLAVVDAGMDVITNDNSRYAGVSTYFYSSGPRKRIGNSLLLLDQRDPVTHQRYVMVGISGYDNTVYPEVTVARLLSEECGDGFVFGAEQCDDANLMPNDGCDAQCVSETAIVPSKVTCTAGSESSATVCSAICGDGFRISAFEECDAGASNGPAYGCSSTCDTQLFWTCAGGSASGPDVCNQMSYMDSIMFEDDYARLWIDFRNAVTSTVTSCADIFDSTSLTKLGTGATCVWWTTKQLVVTLSPSATVMPGDALVMTVSGATALFGSYNAALASTSVVQSSNGLLPATAAITIPSTISACAALVLDGTSSAGAANRPLVYAWTLLSLSPANAGELNRVQTLLASETAAIVTLPANSLLGGTTYQFQLTVTNFLSESSITTANVMILASPSPLLNILGGASITVSRSEPLNLDAELIRSPCSSPLADAAVTVVWTQDSGPALSMADLRSNRINPFSLTIPPFFLASGASYVLKAAAIFGDGSSAADSVTIVVNKAPVVARIVGGNRVLHTTTALTLDASTSRDDSYDPSVSTVAGSLTFAWTCVIGNTSLPCVNQLGHQINLPSTATLSFPANTFDATHVIFSVKVESTVNLLESDRASVEVRFITGSGPRITIVSSPLSRVISPADSMLLEATVASASPASLTTAWSVVSSSPLAIVTPPSQLLLKVAEKQFVPGTAYTFLLTATDSSGTSSNNITILTDILPTGGSISITPTSGTALSTLFTIDLPNWSHALLPLDYAFAYSRAGSTQSIPLRAFSSKQTVSLTLPEGSLTVTGHIRNALGTVATVSTSVTVAAAGGSIAAVTSVLSSQMNSLVNQQVWLDGEQALQQLTVLAQTMAVGTSSVTSCPNGCSSHGSCVNTPADVRMCKCDSGYSGRDCSLSATDETVREDVVGKMISVLTNLAATVDLTPEVTQQIASTMNLILQDPTLVTVAQAQSLSTLLGTMLSSWKSNTASNVTTVVQNDVTSLNQVGLDSTTAELLLQAISELSVILTADEATAETAKVTLTNSLMDNLQSLGLVLSNNMVPGQESIHVNASTVSLTVGRDYGYRIGGSSYGSVNGSSLFTVPSSILSNHPSLTSTSPLSLSTSVDAVAWLWSHDLYQYLLHGSIQNSSYIASLTLFSSATGAEIPISGLSAPVEMNLPVSSYYAWNNITDAACNFFDTSISNWSTAGCSLVSNNSALTQFTCECTHLTNFVTRFFDAGAQVLGDGHWDAPFNIDTLANLTFANATGIYLVSLLLFIYSLVMMWGHKKDKLTGHTISPLASPRSVWSSRWSLNSGSEYGSPRSPQHASETPTPRLSKSQSSKLIRLDSRSSAFDPSESPPRTADKEKGRPLPLERSEAPNVKAVSGTSTPKLSQSRTAISHLASAVRVISAFQSNVKTSAKVHPHDAPKAPASAKVMPLQALPLDDLEVEDIIDDSPSTSARKPIQETDKFIIPGSLKSDGAVKLPLPGAPPPHIKTLKDLRIITDRKFLSDLEHLRKDRQVSPRTPNTDYTEDPKRNQKVAVKGRIKEYNESKGFLGVFWKKLQEDHPAIGIWKNKKLGYQRTGRTTIFFMMLLSELIFTGFFYSKSRGASWDDYNCEGAKCELFMDSWFQFEDIWIGLYCAWLAWPVHIFMSYMFRSVPKHKYLTIDEQDESQVNWMMRTMGCTTRLKVAYGVSVFIWLCAFWFVTMFAAQFNFGMNLGWLLSFILSIFQDNFIFQNVKIAVRCAIMYIASTSSDTCLGRACRWLVEKMPSNIFEWNGPLF